MNDSKEVDLMTIESALDDSLIAYQNLAEENLALRQEAKRNRRALHISSFLAGSGWLILILSLLYQWANQSNSYMGVLR